MKEMQRLQPQLVELKEKYRDDPQKLNRATMRPLQGTRRQPLRGLYTMASTNSDFWALFALLGGAVELRGAPFLLWIDDLSAPDTLVKLPFTIPLIITQIDTVRLLPINKRFNNLAPTEIRRQYGTNNGQHASEIDAVYAAHFYLHPL